MREVTAEKLKGIVEIDETYIGGKYDKRRKRGKYDKEPVFGMVQRDAKARAYRVRPTVTISSARSKTTSQ